MSEPIFHYNLQVWTVDGIVQPCGHPDNMKTRHTCCVANLYRNMRIEDAWASYRLSRVNIDRIISR